MTDTAPHAPAEQPDTIDLVGRDFLDDPYAVYAQIRADGTPIRRVRLRNGVPGWLVTRYADARAALADPRLVKNPASLATPTGPHPSRPADAGTDGQPPAFAAALSHHMLSSDPPDHTRLRKLVNKAFTARTVADLEPRIEVITDDLLDRADRVAAQHEGIVDLIDALAFPLPVIVICELLGVPFDDREDFRRWSQAIISATTDPAGMATASREMADYLIRLIADKRARPGADLLTELIQVSEEGDRLSEDELVSMGFLLLVAGHETTVNLIGNGTLALLRHPDQLALLRDDPSLLPAAIEEFLRYDGPVNVATARFAAEPVTIAGQPIATGELVMVSLSAADHDPDRYPEPDRLDIERTTTGHLAFGHGIHFCVGAPLARLEGRIAIGRLVTRHARMELAGAPQQLSWRASTLLRGLYSLPVRLG